MTESLRDKLISCGWVTNFNADTLVRLIKEHYEEEVKQPELPGVHGQWIDSNGHPPTKEYGYHSEGLIQRLIMPSRGVCASEWTRLGKGELWRPFSEKDTRPIVSNKVSTSTPINPEVAPKNTQSSGAIQTRINIIII